MFSWKRTPPEPTRPILDRAYLARLAQFIGPVETGEMLADGMLELSERLNRARALAAESNPDDLAKLLHDITGSSGHMGLSALSAEAAIGHRALMEGRDPASVIEPLLEIETPSLDALRDYCQNNPDLSIKEG